MRGRSGLTTALCGLLAALAVAVVAAWAAAWHGIDVLQGLPPENDGGEQSRVAMWFGNTMGVRNALLVVAAGGGVVWLFRMRTLAESLWPGGQRRHRAWLVLGWIVPIADVFIPKMIMNDLWAASDPARRRGGALLGWWWLSCLLVGGNAQLIMRNVPELIGISPATTTLGKAETGDGCLLAMTLLTLAVVWQLGGRLELATRAGENHPVRMAPSGAGRPHRVA